MEITEKKIKSRQYLDIPDKEIIFFLLSPFNSTKGKRNMRKKLAITLVLSLLIVPLSQSSYADSKKKFKVEENAVFTIIHAIPATFGADKVDVYSNGQLILDNATPGSSKTFSFAPGSQQIAIFPDGVTPTSGTVALLSYPATYLSKNSNVSFVAHLSAENKPKISLFKNMTTEPGSKRSWLTVRHIAGAPTVDVRANSKLLFRSLSNAEERKTSLRFGSYPVDAVLTQTSTVVIPSINFAIKDNINYVVYAWGSASKSNLQFLVQEVVPRKEK